MHISVAAISVFLAALMTGTAFAGSPSGKSPTYDWSGSYAGLHAGYGWGHGDAVDLGDDFFDEGFRQTHDVDTDGFIGGVQVGHNWQSGSFVYGLEADLGYLGVDGKRKIIPDVDNYGSAEFGIYGDLTARFGYALDRALIYAKGGVAATHYDLTYGDLDSGDLDPDSSASESGVLGGVTIGGGVEWAYNDKWTAKLEYQYFDFGKVTLTDINGDQASVDLDAHTIMLGLNYRF